MVSFIHKNKDTFVEGVRVERERIIALLQAYANAECDEYCSFRCECFAKYEAQMFIEQIKGENE